MNRDKKRRQKEGKGRRGWLSKGTGKREFYYIEEGSHCEGERMWGVFLVHGNEKSVFLKEGEDCVNRTDGEGEDFSFFWKRRRRGCRQHSRTHCVALSRQQGAHYSTACRMNRRLSVQQPFRQDGPAERGWRCQSDAVLIWVPLLQVWLRLEMSTMVLGVRKRRHCERGEKGQTAPRVTLPLRSLCILRCRVLVSGFRASVLMKHNEWKIPKRMCGREVKLAVRDVTMVSLFPWFVPPKKWMSRLQHSRVCWGSTSESTNHVEMMLILSKETFWCFCVFASRTTLSNLGWKTKSPAFDLNQVCFVIKLLGNRWFLTIIVTFLLLVFFTCCRKICFHGVFVQYLH